MDAVELSTVMRQLDLQTDLEDELFGGDKTCLRLRCKVPGEGTSLALLCDIKGMALGSAFPSVLF